jgi:hypothetical protein
LTADPSNEKVVSACDVEAELARGAESDAAVGPETGQERIRPHEGRGLAVEPRDLHIREPEILGPDIDVEAGRGQVGRSRRLAAEVDAHSGLEARSRDAHGLRHLREARVRRDGQQNGRDEVDVRPLADFDRIRETVVVVVRIHEVGDAIEVGIGQALGGIVVPGAGAVQVRVLPDFGDEGGVESAHAGRVRGAQRAHGHVGHLGRRRALRAQRVGNRQHLDAHERILASHRHLEEARGPRRSEVAGERVGQTGRERIGVGRIRSPAGGAELDAEDTVAERDPCLGLDVEQRAAGEGVEDAQAEIDDAGTRRALVVQDHALVGHLAGHRRRRGGGGERKQQAEKQALTQASSNPSHGVPPAIKPSVAGTNPDRSSPPPVSPTGGAAMG